jgi:hypothetical protein
MSKKHFEALAKTIQARLDTVKNATHLTGVEQSLTRNAIETIARDVANVCADANPRFDTHRFLKACGI